MRFPLALAALATISLAFVPAPAPQELSPTQQNVMRDYQTLIKLQDQAGIQQLVTRDLKGVRACESIVDAYCVKFVETGDKKLLDEIRPMAAAADTADECKRFDARFKRIEAYNEEQRKKWIEVYDAYVKALNAFGAANQKKEPSEFRRALGDLDVVVQESTKLGDLEMESYCLYHVGVCHEELSEYPEVVSTYDKAMDDWVNSGRPKNAFYQHMVEKRRELIEKGFDPLQKDKPADGGGKKNSSTSYHAGSDWQEWTTEYKEAKEPALIPSISPWCCEHVLLWREFTWNDGARPLGILVHSHPFGKDINIVREGAKGFYDNNDDKKPEHDQPAKVIDGKASLSTVKSGDGKDAESYAYFLLSGGQGQTWFQSVVNFSNSGRYRIGCYREGKILGETIQLLDDNATGNFGDPSEQRDNVIEGNPTFIDNDAVQVGKQRVAPWSDVLQIAGKWYHVKPVDAHGKKLRTRELDIETGNVIVKWNGPVPPKNLVVAELNEFKGAYFDVAGGKPVAVPVGRYELAGGRIETGKGAQLKQAWIFKGDAKTFEVKAGETVTLDMGGPYTLNFSAKDNGKTATVTGKSMVLREKSGAIVGRIYDEVLFPDVSMRAKGGATIGKAKAMEKISAEVFNSDNAAVWFAGDAVVPKSEKAKVEFHLELKKHALLGGPCTSEWVDAQ